MIGAVCVKRARTDLCRRGSKALYAELPLYDDHLKEGNANVEAWKMQTIIEHDVFKHEIGGKNVKLKWASGYRISNDVAVPSFNIGLAFGPSAINLEFRGK